MRKTADGEVICNVNARDAIQRAVPHMMQNDLSNRSNLQYSQGGIGLPVDAQKMMLSGNGRLMKRCGASLPTVPMTTATATTAVPIFFSSAISLLLGVVLPL